MNPEEFLRIIRERVHAWVRELLDDLDIIKFGTIPGSYAAGRPTVTFDGESTASTKTYPYLSSYTPTAGHRVALIRAGHTWLILGRML